MDEGDPRAAGIWVSEDMPVSGGTHRYEDLTEREAAMSDLLTRSCFRLLSVRRLPFVH